MSERSYRSPRRSPNQPTRRISNPIVERLPAGPDGKVTLKLLTPRGYQPLPTDDDDGVADGELERNEGVEVGNATIPIGEQIIDSASLQSVMAFMIVANAGVIGLETDLPGLMNWNDVENIFLLIFTVELVLRISIIGPVTLFTTHKDSNWNLFDLVIVGLGVFDFIMSATGGVGSGGFSTVFRIVRLLRILRIFRIIKFLKQLYLLAFGLVEATKAVMWVAILMCFVLYVCAIVLVRTVGRLPETDEHYEFLHNHFGSIAETMLTLFVLMSSPNLPIYQEEIGLLESKPLFCLFLIGFITFGSFGIIAMLTGVISESMFEKNEMRKEEARAEYEAMRKDLGKKAAELFASLPGNSDNEASIDTVFKMTKKMRDLLQSTGAKVTVDDVHRMIENMDDNSNGRINGQTFVHTMEKIAEGVHPLGIQELYHELAGTHHELAALQSAVDNVSDRMESMTIAMESFIRGPQNDNSAKQVETDKSSMQLLCSQAEADRAAFKTQCSTFADSALTIVDTLAKQTAQMRSDMEIQYKELTASHERMFQDLQSSLCRAELKKSNGILDVAPASTSNPLECFHDDVVISTLAPAPKVSQAPFDIGGSNQLSDALLNREDLNWELRTSSLARQNETLDNGAVLQ